MRSPHPSRPAAPSRAEPRLRRVAAALAALSIVMTLAGLGLQVAVGSPADISLLVTLAVAGIVYAAVGARIVRAEPRNLVGWLLIASGLSWAFTLAAVQYQALAVAIDGTLPGVVPLAWLATWSWMPGAAMFIIFVPLVFPNGRLASRRWRGFVAFVVVVVAIDAVAHAVLALDHLDDLAYLANEFEAGSEPGPLGVVAGVGDAWLLLSLVAVSSILLRLRRSVGVERLQIRWFAWALTVAAILFAIEGAVVQTPTGPLSVIGVTIIPVSLAIAILRYRLYDLDRLVSRTISYGLVTATLVATYAGLILLLEGPLGSFTNGDTVSVALSTLGVAAVFQPVRRRIQHVVDHRFDRARYDGERTATAFSARMRDAHDLSSLATDLDRTVRLAMAPSTVGVWVRSVTTQREHRIP